VAVLDRNREHRKFQRLAGSRLERLLPASDAAAPAPAAEEGEKPPPTGPEGDVDDGSSPL
jgi:proteasome alpha subunit